MLGVSALHYSTRSREEFQALASACALHLTTSYSCPSISDVFQGVLRISASVQKLSGSLEANPELSVVQREVSIEVKNKTSTLEVTGLLPEVQNRGSRGSI